MPSRSRRRRRLSTAKVLTLSGKEMAKHFGMPFRRWIQAEWTQAERDSLTQEERGQVLAWYKMDSANFRKVVAEICRCADRHLGLDGGHV